MVAEITVPRTRRVGEAVDVAVQVTLTPRRAIDLDGHGLAQQRVRFDVLRFADGLDLDGVEPAELLGGVNVGEHERVRAERSLQPREAGGLAEFGHKGKDDCRTR